MRNIFIYSLLILIMMGCATHSSYDTFQAREKEYELGAIALQDGGLTSEQMNIIKSTKLANEFPIDIALVIIKNGYIEPEKEKILISQVVAELKKYDKLARIIPIPNFLVPQKINFAKIQELGIRTMTEYVLVLYIDSNTLFKWTVIIETEYKIDSIIDFLLVDSQTTAIMATDKLYSSIIYKENIFKSGGREKAEMEIFSEQGSILAGKIKQLFK